MEKTIIIEKKVLKKRENETEGRTNISDDTINDDDLIIKSVEETKGELERLRISFNFISDPKLVESIIYKERDAMVRYEYLLIKAKEKGIKVSDLYIYNKACVKY